MTEIFIDKKCVDRLNYFIHYFHSLIFTPMNNEWPNFLADIKRAVGEKNYSKAMKAIKESICPQYTAYLILTKGFQNRKKCRILNHICQSQIQSNNTIQITTSWANRSFFFPQPPVALPSEISDIHQFLSIRGNPYSYNDLFKLCQTEKSFINPDSILNYLWRIGWHRGINIQKVFAEISNPDTNGDLTEIYNESYRLLSFPIGYPHHTGQTEKDSVLFNNDWMSYGQKDEEEDENSNRIFQVTDEMENIEDNNNQLDVEIMRNRNIYRLLLFGGVKALQASQVAADELNAIYGNKGDFILSMLENEDVATALYPVLLKRLRDRSKKLYIRKINESREWSMQLEAAIPDQRVKYSPFRKLSLWLRDEFSTLEAKEISYPNDKVYLLEKFIQIIISPDNLNSIEFKKILTNLRSTKILDIKLSYYRALCLYSGALFLNELFSADVIDPITSSSVKTAIEIGISDVEKHGHLNILTMLAEALKKVKDKKGPIYPVIESIINDISGLLFDIEYEKSNYIAAAGALFYKTLADVESDVEQPFINCKVGNGMVSLSLTSGTPFEFDLKLYNVYKTAK